LVVTFAVPDRCSCRRGVGCLAVVACLALTAEAAPLGWAAEPADAAIDAEAIPLPVPEEWAAELSAAPSCTSCTGGDSSWGRSRFRVDYDNGFAILPVNPEETPFSLTIRNQNMFRYDGFARAEPSRTDSAGNVLPINNSNYFGIPRGRLIFAGNCLLPNLSYLLNIDYNSVTSQPIGFRAFWLSYRYSEALELYVGQSKVPGSREWIESAFAPLQSADRTMATTFFRPSLSQGIWVTGEPLDDFHYHAMVSNGFNTLNLIPEELNNRFAWAGSAWWEPWGEFGRGYSDIQHHDEAAFRLGGSYTFALGSGSQSASDAVENSPVRLSDGTIITTPNALAPGVTLTSYDISLAALDAAWKYRGLGLSTEIYFQDLLGLRGTGPLPFASTSAFGGFIKGGVFLVPRETEVYARGSFVTGAYGSGSELGGGCNHFFLPGKDNLFFTCDFAWLENSPAGQNRTGFVAGQTGLLARAQIVAVF
jgi:hypothetical protein